MLRRLGADVVEVRKPEQLDGLDGLVIPGGESTTFMRLMRLYGLDEAIRRFERPDLRHVRRDDRARPRPPRPRRPRRRPQRVRAPGARASRPTSTLAGDDEPLRGVFIRAPRFGRSAPDVEVLAEHDGEPVLVREGRFLVASFHPELTDDTRVHERFLELGRRRRRVSGHSKWSSIKHKKGAADAKRGKLFSKLSRAIIVAAKEGGPDPGGQPRAAERDREGALVLDAEGQHRARDRARLGRGRRRATRTRRSSTRATAPAASRSSSRR